MLGLERNGDGDLIRASANLHGIGTLEIIMLR